MIEARSFLASFGRAVATMVLYGEGHPSIGRAVERAWRDLDALLTAAPHVVFTFLDETILLGDMPVADLKGWEWSERLSAAGIQRIQFDAPFTRGDLEAFLSSLVARFLCHDLAAESHSKPVSGVRYGSVGLRRSATLEPAEPLQTATLSFSLREESEAARWLDEEVRARHPIPLVEAEMIVRSLSVAMHGVGERLMLPLMDLKDFDEYSTTHSLNVSVLAMGLAERVGVDPEGLHDIGLAAMLHDIGKTLVPLEILNKNGRHTAAESRLMRRHPSDGARLILESDKDLDLAALVAYEHHVWFDGSGYPELRFPRSCHPVSRLVHVCDVYDALRTRRPYREAWPVVRAVACLRESAGVEFDPQFVERFVSMIIEAGEEAPMGTSICPEPPCATASM